MMMTRIGPALLPLYSIYPAQADDDDKDRPCFTPLVWTYNDQNAMNPPNPAVNINLDFVSS